MISILRTGKWLLWQAILTFVGLPPKLLQKAQIFINSFVYFYLNLVLSKDTSEKWDPRPRTLCGSGDTRPRTHFIDETWDPESGSRELITMVTRITYSTSQRIISFFWYLCNLYLLDQSVSFPPLHVLFYLKQLFYSIFLSLLLEPVFSTKSQYQFQSLILLVLISLQNFIPLTC